jgi:hypothetical protein
MNTAITLLDIKPGSEFQIQSGTTFIIHQIIEDAKHTLVTSHMPGQREGYYRNEIQDLVNFLNEKTAIKLI